MKTSSPRYIIFTVALLLYSGHAVCAEIETKNVVAITTSSGTSDNTTETVYAGMYLCSPSDSAPGNADIADVTVRTDIAAALSIAKGERYQPVSLYGIRNDTSGKNVIDARIGVTLDALANSIVGAAEVRVGSITAVHAPHGSAVIQRPVAVTGVVVAADAMGDSTVLIDTLGGVSAKRVEGAGDISITGIDVSARSSDATAGIDLAICGVSGDDAATMDGATTISGVTVKAQARNDARAVVLVTGMTGKGDTAAGDIALENITVTAESERASAEIQTMVYAVQNTGGDAVTTGRLTASARTAVSRTDADADGADTTGVVSESVLGVFGLYIRKGTAEARGDITVKAESVATGGDAPLGYSLAAGIYSARGITLGDSANRDPIGVDARAGTYAVALWGDNSAADDAQPHTTIVNGPARLSAKAASRSNDLALAKMPALPVTEAEYLGFGVNDVLLFSLNGQTMDNAGEPLRLFGAEHLHVRRGKIVLADRSRIVNQRSFL
ncbi:MAG: hypothetical protein LUG50_12400, partial [Planctomycetaceae bacterium]|nr:hypothetical protein [Planctomycetaceae bacterium]